MKPESSSTIAPATLHSVALVEDDAGTRRLLVEVVNQIPGFRCIAHFDCAETAIEKLPGKSPAIVLMDIKLPGASGIDCVRHLKPRMPATHFLMLTTYEEANEIFEALAAGAVGYLLKREAPEKLVAALHEVLDGGSPMSSIVARRVQHISQNYSPVAFVVWSSTVAVLPFVALSFVFDPEPARWHWLQARASSWLAAAYLGWGATVIGYGLWTSLLKRHPANRVAPFGLGVPIVGLAAGMLVLGEVITAWQWAGIALLVAALACVMLGGLLKPCGVKA